MTCECTTTLCSAHQQSFKDILNDIPDRLSTMRVSITKQAVMGGQGGKPTNDDDRPIPLNLGAAEANTALRAELVNVTARVRHCLDQHPPTRDRNIPGVCNWLVRLLPAIARHPESVAWYEALSKAYEKTTRAIDLPPERVRAGTCTCGQVLYTVEGRDTVTCKPCGETYDVAERQAAELEKIMGFEANAALIIKALEHAGTKLKLKTLTSWADRDKVPYTTTEDGRVFRVGDVINTMQEMSKVTA